MNESLNVTKDKQFMVNLMITNFDTDCSLTDDMYGLKLKKMILLITPIGAVFARRTKQPNKLITVKKLRLFKKYLFIL